MGSRATFVERVKSIGLDVDQFVVIGSGILDVYGIRHADYIDLVVTKELFTKLAGKATMTVTERHGEEVVYGDINGEQLEAWRNWMTPDLQHQADFDYLIQHSTEIDGVRLVSLEYVEAWKESTRRTKDLRDLELIATYRQRRDDER